MTFDPNDNLDFSGKTFLVIDDFPGMRNILRDILRKCGAQVEAAAGAFVMGTQALPRIRVVAAGAGIVKIHAAACISCSSLAASVANARMPSASFSVAMASALSA